MVLLVTILIASKSTMSWIRLVFSLCGLSLNYFFPLLGNIEFTRVVLKSFKLILSLFFFVILCDNQSYIKLFHTINLWCIILYAFPSRYHNWSLKQRWCLDIKRLLVQHINQNPFFFLSLFLVLNAVSHVSLKRLEIVQLTFSLFTMVCLMD